MSVKAPRQQADPDSSTRLTPFLRWAGGKRWFVKEYRHLIPMGFNRYVEPFLGSGAVYFHLKPTSAIISDTNPDLITAYLGVKEHSGEVYERLRCHQEDHNADHYYRTRSAVPDGIAAQAARIIYLNRTCFNGIYRVNLQGRFNVPVGDRGTVLFDSDDFAETAELLACAEIVQADFEWAIDRAGPGDLVYSDPPYTVRHNNNGFIKYNETLFSWDDQERLVKALARAADRGVRILATNAAHDSVRALYRDAGFALTEVSRFSPIAASAGDRKQYTEIVISNP